MTDTPAPLMERLQALQMRLANMNGFDASVFDIGEARRLLVSHLTPPPSDVEAICERLRRHAKTSASSGWYSVEDDARQAASLIESLSAEIEKLKSYAATDEQIEQIHALIEQHEIEPHYKGRRALDKSCGEIIEITDHECVPAEGYPVVQTVDQPNFAGEAAASIIARVMSRSWLTTEIIKVLQPNFTRVEE